MECPGIHSQPDLCAKILRTDRKVAVPFCVLLKMIVLTLSRINIERLLI